MQFGMRAHDLNKQEFKSLTSTLKEMDIKNIQLAFGKAISDIDFKTGNFSEGLCNYVSKELTKNDIHISVLGSYINPVLEDKEMLNGEIQKFKEHLKYAKLLNASMVGTETGKVKTTNDIEIERNYQLFLSTMREIKDTAEKLGVFFAVEGVAKETLCTSKMMKRFFYDIDSPNALAIYDPANLIYPEEALHNEIAKNIDNCFLDYADKMSVVHLKDFNVITDEMGNKVKESAKIGEGVMDFERIFYHLKRKKPYITMLIEESSKDQYQKDIDYLKNVYLRI